MIDPERLSDLRIAKLRTLASTRWIVPAEATVGSFPSGATLFDPVSGRGWVMIDEDADRRLGGVLAVSLRNGATEVHVISDDAEGAAVLARRATRFKLRVHVWHPVGGSVEPVDPAPVAVDAPPDPAAEPYREVLLDAGLDPVVEGGHLSGEILGLEVARVVVDEAGARVEGGVGRFDREAGAMVRGHLPEADALDRVSEFVRPVRAADAERHPLNQLVLDRWLRAVVIARPELVGAAELRAVGSARPRASLLEDGVATAVGVDGDGLPLVVVCCVGVYLDFVTSAADDHLTHDPDARLVLVVPARDDVPVTRAIAGQLVSGADLVAVPDDWRSLGPERT